MPKIQQVLLTCVLINCKNKQPHSQTQPLWRAGWVRNEAGRLDSTELNFTFKVSKTKTKNDDRTDSEKVCPPLSATLATNFLLWSSALLAESVLIFLLWWWVTGTYFGLSLQASGSPARVWTTRSWSMVSTPTSDSIERRTSGDTW